MTKLIKILFLLISILTYGQIKTTKVIPKEDLNTSKPYDSLSNFLGEDVYKYIGQELYLKGTYESSRHYGYRDFKTTTNDESNLLVKSISSNTKVNFGENVYKCCNEKGSYNSKYEDLAEKYFEVLDVTEKIHESSALGRYHEKNYYYLKLKEKSSGDILYYEYNSKYKHSFPFVVVGFYEKLKKNYIGKKFVFAKNNLKSIDLNTGKPIVSQLGDKWECIDITVDENTYELSLVLKDKLGQKLVWEYNYFFPEKLYYFFTAEEAEKYGRKFGIENWKTILQGNVKIGMTKEMCKLSWGEPNDINTTITSSRKSEQWVYASNYLYFTSGILTTIQ